jgi:Zn-dependent peptidase ImmA (M78 family)
MRPEEKFAQRLLERHSIIPPYNLESLVSLYAKVDFLYFPVEADGISLGLKKYDKPIIYINSSRPEVRQRFTMAHELGHVIIPWHIGNIVSHADIVKDEQRLNSNLRVDEYREIEYEANRFAAELLVPSLWIKEIFEKIDIFSFEDTLSEIIEKTGTSRDTTLIKVFNALPPGYTCAQVDRDTIVVNSFMSLGTQVYKLSVNTDCKCEPYSKYKEKTSFKLGDKNYVLWSFQNSIELPYELDNRSWREILNIILIDTGLQSAQSSINATLPSVFQSGKEQSDSEIFSRIVHRYSQKEVLKDFFQHPLFEQYVIKRLKELRLKQNKN